MIDQLCVIAIDDFVLWTDVGDGFITRCNKDDVCVKLSRTIKCNKGITYVLVLMNNVVGYINVRATKEL